MPPQSPLFHRPPSATPPHSLAPPQRLSEDELAVVERSGAEGSSLVGEFEVAVVRQLYCKGLLYFDVPVYPHDHFQVSSLEGFVSNVNQQHQDQTERWESWPLLC